MVNRVSCTAYQMTSDPQDILVVDVRREKGVKITTFRSDQTVTNHTSFYLQIRVVLRKQRKEIRLSDMAPGQ
jgi:hypothetical protein